MSEGSINFLIPNRAEYTKPDVTFSEVTTCLSKKYGLKEGLLNELQGFDDLNFHFKPTVSCNPFIKTLWDYGYVVKIMNSADSLKSGLWEAQNELMLFLRERNIPSPKPIQTISGDYYTKETFPMHCERVGDGITKVHIVRVFEYHPGTILKETPKSYPLFYKLGIITAKLDGILKEFSHPFYETHKSEWHLQSVPEVKRYSELVQDTGKRELVNKIIEKFIDDVLTKTETFEEGIIHGDINEGNVLMTKISTGEWEVSAILDFGDSHYSYYLFELAIAMCYMMFECKRQGLDPVVGAGHLLAGYLTIRPNFLVDYALLKTCISARICQSLVLGLKAFRIQPQNKYVLSTQDTGWQILEEFWVVSEEQVTKTWNSIIESYNIKSESNRST